MGPVWPHPHVHQQEQESLFCSSKHAHADCLAKPVCVCLPIPWESLIHFFLGVKGYVVFFRQGQFGFFCLLRKKGFVKSHFFFYNKKSIVFFNCLFERVALGNFRQGQNEHGSSLQEASGHKDTGGC